MGDVYSGLSKEILSAAQEGLTMVTKVRYSLNVIKDETRQLVEKGLVSRQQPIYILCQYFPASQLEEIERELELNEFLLRDRIIDLLAQERWQND